MIAAARSRAGLAAALCGLTLLALALRAGQLGAQPMIADDWLVATTARNFTEIGFPEPTMWNHPRLRDHLVAWSLSALGEGPWGVKAWSVLLGTLSVPATGLLVLAAGGGAPAALAAALLVAVDGLHLDFSRQGINDVYLAFFPVAALAAILRYRERRTTGWLIGAGLLLGLGLASKWGAAFPVAVGAALLLRDAARLPDPRARAAEATFLVAALGLLPLLLYGATFLPWFERGYGLADFVRLQIAMGAETVTHTGYGTKLPGFPGELVGAWKWFLVPVWYADDALVPVGYPPAKIVGVGNPLVWLLVLPACGFLAWRALRRGDRTAGFLAAAFLAAWLPFALARRPIWTNSALAVIPFSAAAVALAAERLRAARPRLVAAWLALAVAGAALLWPPAIGRSTGPTDAVVRLLVPAEGLAPRAQLPPGPGAPPGEHAPGAGPDAAPARGAP